MSSARRRVLRHQPGPARGAGAGGVEVARCRLGRRQQGQLEQASREVPGVRRFEPGLCGVQHGQGKGRERGFGGREKEELKWIEGFAAREKKQTFSAKIFEEKNSTPQLLNSKNSNQKQVNMSVAIIPMAHDFGWSPTTSGLVQSAFFAGYALTQVPGGYQAAKRGGAVILPLGVALWSMATAAVPLAADTGALPLLLLCRAAVGAGEGLAPSSATDMIARATPPSERARTVSFVFGGLHAGSLVGLLAAPPLIDAFGWRAVFYGFGGVGLLWCLWWRSVLDGVARDEPGTRAKLAHAADEGTNDDGSTSSYSSSSSSGSGSSSEDDDESEAQVVVGAKELLAHGKKAAAKSDGTLSSSSSSERVPWRAFLRNGPYRALAATHFANNWLHYALMAWLPTYFRDTLSLSLDQAAAVSLLPPAAALAVASAAGPLADALLEAGVSLGAARKAAQAAAFLPPAAALVAAGTLARGDGPMTVALIAAALGLSSFSLAGLYCNHADLSPRYAPLLLGGTTAVGAVPGVVGVAATGFLLDASGGDWSLALFAPTSALLVLGTAIFTLWGSAEEQEWEGDDGPLWIETAWGQLVNGGGGGDGGGSGNGSENGKGE